MQHLKHPGGGEDQVRGGEEPSRHTEICVSPREGEEVRVRSCDLHPSLTSPKTKDVLMKISPVTEENKLQQLHGEAGDKCLNMTSPLITLMAE